MTKNSIYWLRSWRSKKFKLYFKSALLGMIALFFFTVKDIRKNYNTKSSLQLRPDCLTVESRKFLELSTAFTPKMAVIVFVSSSVATTKTKNRHLKKNYLTRRRRNKLLMFFLVYVHRLHPIGNTQDVDRVQFHGFVITPMGWP